ncbi:MAG: glycosyltransferase [Peptoniphilaceae bacterium]|nr:glycosyltransferase [Peptoniphilaceae bacterium]MDY6018996.1 glycosyltransferase [Anaerococcus sp.]
MNIEVIVSTMNQTNIDFYKKLNIETDCLIINQTDHNSYQEIEDKGNRIRMISTDTKGSGISRNLGLNNSQADIIIMADDDEVFEKGYKDEVYQEFKNHPDVDFFVFKTEIINKGKTTIKVKKDSKLSLYNSLKYGTIHFVFKREAIAKKNLSFSTYFGAGSPNGGGEDSLFIADAHRKGLNVRSSTKLLAKIYNDQSTWFEGFNEKFFYNKGKLSRALFPCFYRLYIYQYLLRHKEYFEKVSKKDALTLMLKGAREFGGKK